MIPVVSIVGCSNSGKTTLMEKLLREFKRRGYRVATIKHTHEFEIDYPGKDTWKHAQAGADIVVISSPAKIAVMEKLSQERSLDEITAGIEGVDLILTEGYKSENKPKVEVVRAAISCCPISKSEELLAVATDLDLEIDVPQYDLDDVPGLVDLLERHFGLGSNPDC